MITLSDVAAIVTALTALIAVVGSYVHFVLNRSLFPSAEFDIEFLPMSWGPNNFVGEIALVFKNVGANMLIVTAVRCRIVYSLHSDFDGSFAKDPTEPDFAHKIPPHNRDLYESNSSTSSQNPTQPLSPPPSSSPSVVPAGGKAPSATPGGWLKLSEPRTFIQPGVVQCYRKPLALPSGTRLVHVWGAFDYRLELGAPTKFLIGLLARPPKDMDWRNGIANHTVRRTFRVPLGAPIP